MTVALVLCTLAAFAWEYDAWARGRPGWVVAAATGAAFVSAIVTLWTIVISLTAS